MTNDEFQIWLSGYIELEDENVILNAKQLWIIHNHLQLVETVSGELDEKNKWLQLRLQGLSKQTAMPLIMFTEFKRITDQMRKWLLN